MLNEIERVQLNVANAIKYAEESDENPSWYVQTNFTKFRHDILLHLKMIQVDLQGLSAAADNETIIERSQLNYLEIQDESLALLMERGHVSEAQVLEAIAIVCVTREEAE